MRISDIGDSDFINRFFRYSGAGGAADSYIVSRSTG